MYSSTALSFVMVLAAPVTVMADCFMTGQIWGGVEAKDLLTARCKEYYATGTWDAGEKTNECTDLPNYKGIDGGLAYMNVDVNNDADEAREMSVDTCIKLVEKVTSCNYGGKFSEDNWFFR